MVIRSGGSGLKPPGHLEHLLEHRLDDREPGDRTGDRVLAHLLCGEMLDLPC
jgi:hypothetical protein